MVKNNKIMYFIIFKHKNLSLTNSFGEYKSYNKNGELCEIGNYINDKKVNILQISIV
jgi:antitoxin component YwqK of YwqJK toxin-antitoxin module